MARASRAAGLRLQLPGVIGVIPAAELAVEERDRARVRALEVRTAPLRLVARQSALERYFVRGEVSPAQYHDGERLLRDWVSSGLEPQITGAYGDQLTSTSPPVPGIGPAYPYYTAAMRAVGIILSPVLAHVVLHSQSASSWAESIGRPRTDGIAALRLALDALGCFYRQR
jgi:hypothetical protein